MNGLQVTEHRGIRVLTSKQIAEAYETTVDTIKVNFGRNREKYVQGKHYIELKGQELKDFKDKVTNCYAVGKRANVLYLWTEKGALLHAKSINTDKAWEVYDYLVDYYFRTKETLCIKEEKATKISGREVVDVPENARIQEALWEVRKYLDAMAVLIQEYNAYQCKENYLHIKSAFQKLWLSFGSKVGKLMELEPNMITKQGI